MQKICKQFLLLILIFSSTLPAIAADPPNQKDDESIISSVAANINNQCWACPVVGVFYEMMVHYGSVASTLFGEMFRRFFAVVLALWVLFQVLRLMLPFGESDAIKKSWGNLGKRFLIFAVVFSLLAIPSWVWEYLIEPVSSASINVSQTIQEIVIDYNNVSFNDAGIELKNIIEEAGNNKFDWGNMFDFIDIFGEWGDINCNASLEYDAAMENIFLLANLEFYDTETTGNLSQNRTKLICQTEAIQAIFSSGIILGNTVMSVNVGNDDSQTQEEKSRYYAGMLIFIISALIILVFPLFLLEALFKIMIIGMLSPIFIASFVFERWQKFGISAIKILLQSTLTLIFLSCIVAIGISIISYLGNFYNDGSQSIQLFMLEMAQLLPNEYEIKGKNLDYGTVDISLTSAFFWTLFISHLILFVMLTKAGSIASMLTGSQDTGGASQIASQATSMGAMRAIPSGK